MYAGHTSLASIACQIQLSDRFGSGRRAGQPTRHTYDTQWRQSRDTVRVLSRGFPASFAISLPCRRLNPGRPLGRAIVETAYEMRRALLGTLLLVAAARDCLRDLTPPTVSCPPGAFTTALRRLATHLRPNTVARAGGFATLATHYRTRYASPCWPYDFPNQPHNASWPTSTLNTCKKLMLGLGEGATGTRFLHLLVFFAWTLCLTQKRGLACPVLNLFDDRSPGQRVQNTVPGRPRGRGPRLRRGGPRPGLGRVPYLIHFTHKAAQRVPPRRPPRRCAVLNTSYT